MSLIATLCVEYDDEIFEMDYRVERIGGELRFTNCELRDEVDYDQYIFLQDIMYDFLVDLEDVVVPDQYLTEDTLEIETPDGDLTFYLARDD